MEEQDTRMKRYKNTRVKTTKLEENINDKMNNFDNKINAFKRTDGYKRFMYAIFPCDCFLVYCDTFLCSSFKYRY